MQKGVITTAVATVWTSYNSPRPIDGAALARHTSPREWTNTLTFTEKLALANKNALQTQVLLGQELVVINCTDNWCEVLIPEQPTTRNGRGYYGWIPRAQVQLLNKDINSPECYASGTIAIVKKRQTNLKYLENPLGLTDLNNMELSYGTILPVIDSTDHSVLVNSPLAKGTILKKDLLVLEAALFYNNSLVTAESIINDGEQFLKIPYLWGGVSSYGFDCSGLIHLLYRAHGLIIPRDASNQALIGQTIPWSKRRRGDLLFFADTKGHGAIHHVAMYYGDNKILHSPRTGSTVEIIALSTYDGALDHCLTKRYVNI